MTLPEPWIVKSAIVITALGLANAWLFVLSMRLPDGLPVQKPARAPRRRRVRP